MFQNRRDPKVETPVDKIIGKIRNLINSGELKSGYLQRNGLPIPMQQVLLSKKEDMEGSGHMKILP